MANSPQLEIRVLKFFKMGNFEQYIKMNEFANNGVFSRSNLFAMKKFYLFYNQNDIKVQQVVGLLENKSIASQNIAQLVQEFEQQVVN